MKVILFGATGMVGQGVLRECLLDPAVSQVTSVARKPLGQTHEKLREVTCSDFADLSPIEADLAGHDACFFCLGVSSAGMSEADYTHVTYDFAMAAGRTLARLCPEMTFIYVSGEGTDSTEKGRSMWARVKGKTENDLLRLPFKAAYMFRPGLIQPLHGIKSKTGLYRAVYAVTGPLLPALKALAPKHVTTTEAVGRAMIAAAKKGYSKPLLENPDINALAAEG